MPSFVTFESFPIGASVVNDNERSQRYGYSGIVKGHESRSPATRGGATRKGIVVLYTTTTNGATLVAPFEQQYLCDVKQGLVVTESKEAVARKLEQQLALNNVQARVIEAQKLEIEHLKLEREQLNKISKHPAFLIDFGQAECAMAALQAKHDVCTGQDPLDKVGTFIVVGKTKDSYYHKTRRLAEQEANKMSKQYPSHTMQVMQVMSDHTANPVIQSQVTRYD